MIDIGTLEQLLKTKKLKNSFVLCGLDEVMIKEQVDNIINTFVSDGFRDLNVVKFDGNNLKFDDFMNACETLPFMSEKKVVVIYRTNIFRDKGDSIDNKLYKSLEAYFKNPPEHCIIIGYMLLKDKRERANKIRKLQSLDKFSNVVIVDKLKGEKLYNKVEKIFTKNDKKIGKIELRYFCESVENNFDIIEREVEKLVSYTKGRDITKNDIIALLPPKSEEDIFDLVEFISIKKPDKAIDLMNELLNKGENLILILTLIELQFKKLFIAKTLLKTGNNLNDISRELSLPNFVAEKLIFQSKKFSDKQLEKCMKLCVDTEKTLKSKGLDSKTELELMIINTVM